LSHISKLNVFIDAAMNEFANAMKVWLAQGLTELYAGFRAAAGGTTDDAIDLEKELGHSGCAQTTYFAWACRISQ
jgi:hypothetical protein